MGDVSHFKAMSNVATAARHRSTTCKKGGERRTRAQCVIRSIRPGAPNSVLAPSSDARSP